MSQSQSKQDADRLMEQQRYPVDYEDSAETEESYNSCSCCGAELHTDFEFAQGVCEECWDEE